MSATVPTPDALDTGDVTVPALLGARMVNEVLYCERLFYLEWVQGEFVDNEYTVEGRWVHRRADRPTGRLPAKRAPGDTTASSSGADTPPFVVRSLWLSSERLGLTAKIDVLEGGQDGQVTPIEYKRGKKPPVAEGAWLPERAQLCAQVLLLREHDYRCDGAEIYFAGDQRRVPIAIDDTLIEATLAAARRARELAAGGTIPPPLERSPKCVGCSLYPVCLPDEVNALAQQEIAIADAPTTESEEESAEPAGSALPSRVRRLLPARDDKIPLYAQEQGARIGVRGDVLRVQSRESPEYVDARLPNTSHVSLFGNVQITTQAIRALFDHNIPLLFHDYGGRYLGMASGLDANNVELRIAQHQKAGDRLFCLGLARRVVTSKIRNSRTLVRRNHPEPPRQILRALHELAAKAPRAESVESLLGIEGTAARTYFEALAGMLKTSDTAFAVHFDGRNRRPPRDPVNAMLSFCYSLLTKELVLATRVVGLDPLLGFYHRPRFGRPALALDLMEEFRPIVADSVVLGVVNNGAIDSRDFDVSPVGVSLKPAARRRLIEAFERRMDDIITHPVFAYRISYRRVFEVQARLLARFLLGEIPEYPKFETR